MMSIMPQPAHQPALHPAHLPVHIDKHEPQDVELNEVRRLGGEMYQCTESTNALYLQAR